MEARVAKYVDVKEKSGTKGGQSDADGKLEGKG